MKELIYRRHRRKIILVTLAFSFAPFLILGGMIYYQFANLYEDRIRDQILARTNTQVTVLEVFLRERVAVLSAIADTHTLDYMVQPKNLARVFEVMNSRAGGFVDLGVIDREGRHLAYVGPYKLEGLDYSDQPWFDKALSKGLYISDVYMGYRQIPHFVVVVRPRGYESSWMMRATIDSDVFNDLVRSAQVGKTGDAYIINRHGLYQTRSRFDNRTLSGSDLNPSLFGKGVTLVEARSATGRRLLCGGTWLKNEEWLLVITQDPAEGMSKLLTARTRLIVTVILGCIAIALATIWTTRMNVRRLQEADQTMNQLAAQLVQSDKLAALGKMAAGVAHEINNPLAVISEKAGWMNDLLEEEEFRESPNLKEYRKSLQKIEEHVERARKVTHNMLGFARRMEPRLEDVEINTVLNQTLDLLENHARINNIDIQTDLQADLPVISSDQAQLQQVFLNLINNAIDAIEREGNINIKTRNVESRIVIDIKDDGPGIPENIQGRIFDPFFTTKITGKGTGLGLSVTKSIIEQLGGTIGFKSKEGEGTEFRVSLPAVVPEKK